MPAHAFLGENTVAIDVAEREERGLSLLAFRTLERLSRSEPLPEDREGAARAVLTDLPLEVLGGRYAMLDPAVRKALPSRVVESWRFFAGHVEAQARGSVHVADLALDEAHGDVYVVCTTTTRGQGFLEVFAADGAPLASGASRDGRVTSWDERFGAVREGVRRDAREAAGALSASG